MEPKVFLIHGFEGSPNGGWRPWLMGKLALEDIYACALPMPTPDTPKKEEWIEKITQVVGMPSGNVFLVGHSLGVPAILQYLNTLPEGSKIGGVVLVSGPMHADPGMYPTLVHFFTPVFNFDHIKKVCSRFTIVHGDNDRAVPYSDAQEFSSALSCELITIPNGGHLNGSSGWLELPAAFDVLMRFIKG